MNYAMASLADADQVRFQFAAGVRNTPPDKVVRLGTFRAPIPSTAKQYGIASECWCFDLPQAIACKPLSAERQLALNVGLREDENAGLALHEFPKWLGLHLALIDLGLKEDDLDCATGLATSKPYPKLHPVAAPKIRALLQAAYVGETPVIKRKDVWEDTT